MLKKYEAFLLQNADFDEDVKISDDAWLAYQWHGNNNNPLTTNYDFKVGDIPTNRGVALLAARDGITKEISLDRDDDFMRLELLYKGAEALKNSTLEYKYDIQNSLETYSLENQNATKVTTLKSDVKVGADKPWNELLDKKIVRFFIEDRTDTSNDGGPNITDSVVDNNYNEPDPAKLKLVFKRGTYEVSIPLTVHRAGNLYYKYSITSGELPSGNFQFSTGRGLVRFGSGVNDWRFERGEVITDNNVVNSGLTQTDYKKSKGPTPPGMWYCTRRTSWAKGPASNQWDFSQNDIMYMGRMCLWEKLPTYNKNTANERVNDNDLLAKFNNFSYWKQNGAGADPRTARRIRYKYQIGIIQTTGTTRTFSIVENGVKKLAVEQLYKSTLMEDLLVL